MTAGHSVDPARWQETIEGLMSRIAGRFARVEPRRRVGGGVCGWLLGWGCSWFGNKYCCCGVVVAGW
ncbi:hypothetical protein ACWIG3_35860, partial [Streptomyces celluloflavus]